MKIRIFILKCIVLLLLVSYAGSSVAQPGTDCLIKGIIGSDGQKMYILPGHYLYDKVTPDLNKGERWFCEPEGAERAGFIFVPDPTNRSLRPQPATPTPSPIPTATPEPQQPEPVEPAPETAAAEPPQPEDSTPPEPEPTEPPAPEPPTATPAPVETEEPDVSILPDSDITSDDPFSQAIPSGELLGPILQQVPPEALALFIAWMWVFFAIIGFTILMTIVVRWKLFVKAGRPGWGALIPIYSEVLMLQIASLAWWWILLAFFPVVNLAYAIVWIFIRPFKTAENFGKGFLYGLGLFLFPISVLVWLHLAFSDSEYVGP